MYINYTLSCETPNFKKLVYALYSFLFGDSLLWSLTLALGPEYWVNILSAGFSWKLRLLRSTLCTPGRSCKLLRLPLSLSLHSKHVWVLSVGTFDPLFWQLPSLYVVWWEKFESSLVTGLHLDFKLKMDCTTSPRPSASVQLQFSRLSLPNSPYWFHAQLTPWD